MILPDYFACMSGTCEEITMSTPETTSFESEDTSDLLVGEYANYVSVGSTQTEFFIDFMQVVPGTGDDSGNSQVLPVRRLLISPMLARGLMRAIEQEVLSYETTYSIMLPTLES
jgi:Protein of unknown function (DUF3467)